MMRIIYIGVQSFRETTIYGRGYHEGYTGIPAPTMEQSMMENQRHKKMDHEMETGFMHIPYSMSLSMFFPCGSPLSCIC